MSTWYPFPSALVRARFSVQSAPPTAQDTRMTSRHYAYLRPTMKAEALKHAMRCHLGSRRTNPSLMLDWTTPSANMKASSLVRHQFGVLVPAVRLEKTFPVMSISSVITEIARVALRRQYNRNGSRYCLVLGFTPQFLHVNHRQHHTAITSRRGTLRDVITLGA